MNRYNRYLKNCFQRFDKIYLIQMLSTLVHACGYFKLCFVYHCIILFDLGVPAFLYLDMRAGEREIEIIHGCVFYD